MDESETYVDESETCVRESDVFEKRDSIVQAVPRCSGRPLWASDVVPGEGAEVKSRQEMAGLGLLCVSVLCGGATGEGCLAPLTSPYSVRCVVRLGLLEK